MGWLVLLASDMRCQMRNRIVVNSVLYFVAIALLLCLATLWHWDDSKPVSTQLSDRKTDNAGRTRQAVHCIVGVQVGAYSSAM